MITSLLIGPTVDVGKKSPTEAALIGGVPPMRCPCIGVHMLDWLVRLGNSGRTDLGIRIAGRWMCSALSNLSSIGVHGTNP
jgi:hypothetical protein